VSRIISLIFAVVLIGAVGSCVFFVVRAFGDLRQHGDDGAKFADQVLEKLAVRWSREDVVPFLSSTYAGMTSLAADPFANYRILGALTSRSPCSSIGVSNENGRVTTTIACVETFSNGKATVIFALLLSPTGIWSVEDIAVQLD
jgi:hypothetical protein